jgi:hypothetical protein
MIKMAFSARSVFNARLKSFPSSEFERDIGRSVLD